MKPHQIAYLLSNLRGGVFRRGGDRRRRGEGLLRLNEGLLRLGDGLLRPRLLERDLGLSRRLKVRIPNVNIKYKLSFRSKPEKTLDEIWFGNNL